MNENPLKPQIKAKGMMGIQLSQLYSLLMAPSRPPSLAPSVKITFYGYLRHLQYIKLSCSMKQAAKLRPH